MTGEGIIHPPIRISCPIAPAAEWKRRTKRRTAATAEEKISGKQTKAR